MIRPLANVIVGLLTVSGGSVPEPYPWQARPKTECVVDARPIVIAEKNLGFHEIVVRLREAGVSLSLVDPRAEQLPEPMLAPGPSSDRVDGWIRRLLEAAPDYRCLADRGHLALYPNLTKYTRVVAPPPILRVRRIEAIWKYLDWLTVNLDDFKTLGSQALRQMPEGPFYDDLVSLRVPGRVIDHLVQLLGDNPSVVFTLDETCRGGNCGQVRVLGNRFLFKNLAIAAKDGRRQLNLERSEK